MENNIPAK